MDFETLMRNITLTGGVAHARAYIERLLPDVLDGTVQPGKVFDRTLGLSEVPGGYRAMANRAALKILIILGGGGQRRRVAVGARPGCPPARSSPSTQHQLSAP